jgi:hypothetical protein
MSALTAFKIICAVPIVIVALLVVSMFRED